ncbi:MAG: hypothetical protein NZ874_06280 [Fimbriimonadales bacterium]|nr:hypothetical protein [Fimbriimonadales bacterium]
MTWTVVSKQGHGHDCPCYGCTGWKPVPRRGVSETPTRQKPARILKQSLKCLND